MGIGQKKSLREATIIPSFPLNLKDVRFVRRCS